MAREIKNFKFKDRNRAHITEEIAPYAEQLDMVRRLYLNHHQTKATLALQREIERKIRGYKQQDVKKEIYEPETLISFHDILEKMVGSQLKCAYCAERMQVMFAKVREPTQWTLDRVDNAIGHHSENTVVCCLKCNLQRRTTRYDKFVFTKKLIIEKK